MFYILAVSTPGQFNQSQNSSRWLHNECFHSIRWWKNKCIILTKFHKTRKYMRWKAFAWEIDLRLWKSDNFVTALCNIELKRQTIRRFIWTPGKFYVELRDSGLYIWQHEPQSFVVFGNPLTYSNFYMSLLKAFASSQRKFVIQ